MKRGVMTALCVLLISGVAVAGARLKPGGHHNQPGIPGASPIPFTVTSNGTAFMWGPPNAQVEYVWMVTDPQDPTKGYYYTTGANNAVVGTLNFTPGNPDTSGSWTGTGIAGQAGTYTRP